MVFSRNGKGREKGRAGSLKAEVSLVYVVGTLLSFRILQSLSIKLGVIHLVGQRPWLWGKSIQDGEVFTFSRDGAYRYMPQTNWKWYRSRAVWACWVWDIFLHLEMMLDRRREEKQKELEEDTVFSSYLTKGSERQLSFLGWHISGSRDYVL